MEVWTMDLMRSKKGVNEGFINKTISFVIGIAVLFLVVAELLPTAQNAGDTLNSSGVPLGGLFVSGGVIFLIVMAGILLAVVAGARSKR